MRFNPLLAAVLLALTFAIPASAQLPVFSTPFVTRAEAVMILLKTRLRTVPEMPRGDRYIDIPKGAWYENYMLLAAQTGIIQPDKSGRYRPEDVVLRSEFLTLAQRTFGLPEGLPYLYTDVSANAWYAPLAGIAQKYGLFSRDGDQTTLKPESLLTHRETVQALQSLMAHVDASMLHEDEQAYIAREQAQNQLRLYQTMSTAQQTVTLLKEPGRVALTPRLLDTSVPVIPSGEVLLMPGDSSQVQRTLRQQVTALVNSERAAAGLAPVREDADLDGSAQAYADAMALRGFFGHVSPEGETLRGRMERSGYFRSFFAQDCACVGHYRMGENIARGQITAEEVMKAWMLSPAHKAAILTPGFTDLGIGIASGYWVQHFGGKQQTYDLSLLTQ